MLVLTLLVLAQVLSSLLKSIDVDGVLVLSLEEIDMLLLVVLHVALLFALGPIEKRKDVCSREVDALNQAYSGVELSVADSLLDKVDIVLGNLFLDLLPHNRDLLCYVVDFLLASYDV